MTEDEEFEALEQRLNYKHKEQAMNKQQEALKLALEKVQEFKARWWKVPPFGNKVNKATREAITNAHSPIFELENAIREALAEQRPQNCGTGYCSCIECPYEQPAQQQDPVAWAVMKNGECLAVRRFEPRPTSEQGGVAFIPLYTSPPASKPLTDEQIQYAFRTNSVMVDNGNAYMVAAKRAVNIARAIEAAHGIKEDA